MEVMWSTGKAQSLVKQQRVPFCGKAAQDSWADLGLVINLMNFVRSWGHESWC
jgi:hypothetical protein